MPRNGTLEDNGPGPTASTVAAGTSRSGRRGEEPNTMEFLVEFEISVPGGTPESEVRDREDAEATAAAELVRDGHLVRVWSLSAASGETTKILGLYDADSRTQLDELLCALPLYDWMKVTVTALERHPNDPATAGSHR
jgi:muconolactone D-isomerase